MTKAKSSPSNTLKVDGPKDKTTEELICEIATSPFCQNASITGDFTKSTLGERSLTELIAAFKKQVANTRKDMGKAEDILISQAIALDAIFTELARRAAGNMREYLGATDTYMRLALKAQSQCRTTLETVANIKNPPVVFAKQANIAHNQQVNQSVSQGNTGCANANTKASRAEKTKTMKNELLPEESHHELDARTPETTSQTDQKLETVETVHRAKDT